MAAQSDQNEIVLSKVAEPLIIVLIILLILLGGGYYMGPGIDYYGGLLFGREGVQL